MSEYTIYTQRWTGGRVSYHQHPSDIMAFALDWQEAHRNDPVSLDGDWEATPADSSAFKAIKGFGVWR